MNSGSSEGYSVTAPRNTTNGTYPWSLWHSYLRVEVLTAVLDGSFTSTCMSNFPFFITGLTWTRYSVLTFKSRKIHEAYSVYISLYCLALSPQRTLYFVIKCLYFPSGGFHRTQTCVGDKTNPCSCLGCIVSEISHFSYWPN
jgi:hypothetical protein